MRGAIILLIVILSGCGEWEVREISTCGTTVDSIKESRQWTLLCVQTASQHLPQTYQASDEEEHGLGNIIDECKKASARLEIETCSVNLYTRSSKSEWINCSVVKSPDGKLACDNYVKGLQ